MTTSCLELLKNGQNKKQTMGGRTDPWWVCNTCNKKLCRTKKGLLHKVMTEHRKICSYYAGGQIKQIKQRNNGN